MASDQVSVSVADLVSWTGGRVANPQAIETGSGSADQVRVARMADLGLALPGDVAFFFSKAYQADLLKTRASVIVTGEAFVGPLMSAGIPQLKSSVFVACEDPYWALARVSAMFAEKLSDVGPRPVNEGPARVHPTAIVDSSCRLESGVEIGAHVVIGPSVQIGKGSRVGSGCTLGRGVVLGQEVELFPGVHVYEGASIGDRCRFHAGVVIGADGFGYAPRRQGGKVVAHEKIYHLGRVRIGCDVEIGANSCVDRGTLGDTVIGDGAKIDNLVQIGHNVQIGEGAILCGKVGVAGSARVGRFAVVGGLTGITNQVVIGDGARVAACSLVSRDVPPGSEVAGNPQREARVHFRAHAYLNQLLDNRRANRNKGEK